MRQRTSICVTLAERRAKGSVILDRIKRELNFTRSPEINDECSRKQKCELFSYTETGVKKGPDSVAGQVGHQVHSDHARRK